MLTSTRPLLLNFQLFSRNIPGIYRAAKWDCTPNRSYAKVTSGIVGLGKKKIGKGGPTLEKVKLPVETDPEKLVNYCCGLNTLKEGEPPKLKDNSEYPDWLWTLNTGPNLPLSEMDPDTEEYWERAKQISNKRSTSMTRLRKF